MSTKPDAINSGGEGRALDSLFTPFDLGAFTLPNRFIVPAMQRHWCVEGTPLPRMADYFAKRIEGGFSLVIGESSAVDHPSSTQQPRAGWLFGDAMKGWKRCIDAVHAAGGRMFLQLWHEGAVRKENNGGRFPAARSISPSGLVQKGVENGIAASAADLDDLRRAFVNSAKAARDAGADGVEIHSCHGYLLDLFLWAETNRRTDGYGGDDMRHRVRFAAELVAAIREGVGPDFPISFRFSQWKEVDFDARIVGAEDELAIMLGELSEAGVSIFHPSTRRLDQPGWPGADATLAAMTKRISGKPVIAVGSVGLSTDLMSNLFGEEAHPTGKPGLRDVARRLEAGEFDLVAVGRASISDPAWVRKVQAGDFHALRSFKQDDLTAGMDWEMDYVLKANEQTL